MNYGKQLIKGRTYFVYNSFQMRGVTHGEYMKANNAVPILGADTPVRHKRNELQGCTVFIIEVES